MKVRIPHKDLQGHHMTRHMTRHMTITCGGGGWEDLLEEDEDEDSKCHEEERNARSNVTNHIQGKTVVTCDLHMHAHMRAHANTYTNTQTRR